MPTTLDINGNQYSNEHYKNYYGYQCCTTVKHEINLTSNSSDIGNTVDLPQLDTNSHTLVMHLYNNNVLMNLCNVNSVQILFKRNDGTTVMGDWRNTTITNPYRGTIEYLLSKEEVKSIGLNTLQVNLKIGNGEMTFNACYNVIANSTNSNGNIVYPDAPNNKEYPYGPCHHCSCNCGCPCCDDKVPKTLEEMYELFKKHLQDTDVHNTPYKNKCIDNSLVVVPTYDYMITFIELNPNMPDGKMFRVNKVTAEDGTISSKYYMYNATNRNFDEVSTTIVIEDV